jgi:hypothetical protein
MTGLHGLLNNLREKLTQAQKEILNRTVPFPKTAQQTLQDVYVKFSEKL